MRQCCFEMIMRWDSPRDIKTVRTLIKEVLRSQECLLAAVADPIVFEINVICLQSTPDPCNSLPAIQMEGFSCCLYLLATNSPMAWEEEDTWGKCWCATNCFVTFCASAHVAWIPIKIALIIQLFLQKVHIHQRLLFRYIMRWLSFEIAERIREG